jgi:hypothetical protein
LRLTNAKPMRKTLYKISRKLKYNFLPFVFPKRFLKNILNGKRGLVIAIGAPQYFDRFLT